MLQSHVIEFQGVFAGAAVRSIQNFRFVAVLPTLADLHQNEFGSLSELRRTVISRLRQERLPPTADLIAL